MFAGETALEAHKRAPHKVTTSLDAFIGDSGRCPVFNQLFCTHLGILQHVLEKRVRAKRGRLLCRTVLLSRSFLQIPPQRLESLRKKDRGALRACKRDGKSRIPVTLHAKRKLGAPIISEQPRKRIRSKCSPLDRPELFWWRAREAPTFLFTVGDSKRMRVHS